MPKAQTKFCSAWLELIDVNNQRVVQWCRQGKDKFHGYCRYCDSDIRCDNSGKAQILQHAKKEKHRHAIKYVQDDTQGKLLFCASTSRTVDSAESSSGKLRVLNYNDAHLSAEIYWLAKVAVSNYSLRSVDRVGKTFAAMFPDSKIAAGFSLSRTSASYMIGEGMAPHFRQILVNDLVKSNLPFALHFDETSTAQIKKQMDLTLRFWSPTHDEVWVAFYTSLFFGHAEGDKVACAMFEQMNEDNLPLAKLTTLVRDGPNVNKTIFRKLQQMIKEQDAQFSGFIDLGSCVLHIVHNAFGKGLQTYGKELEQLCVDVHSLFKYSAARREDYQDLQRKMEVSLNAFQQHTEVRWLSLGPALCRLLEQWDCICQFLKDLGKDEKTAPKSVNYKRAAAMLTTDDNKVIRVQLEFLKTCTPVFEELLTLFQKSSPTIHLVYDSMCDTLLKLMRRFMKSEALKGKDGPDLACVSIRDRSLQLSDKELVIGDGTKKVLAGLKPEKQQMAILGMRSFFMAAVDHMRSRLPLNNTLLKDLGCLHPLKRDRKSTISSIQNLTRKLQPQLDAAQVADEWKLFQADGDISVIDTSQRIDSFWREVFSLRAVHGGSRYAVLPLVVKSGLILAQTNAESERSLSVNARLMTKDRAQLGQKTITGLRTVREAVRFYDPTDNQPERLPVTKELKQAVRSAHAAYQSRLEDEKLHEERLQKEAKRKKEEEDKRIQESARMAEAKKSLTQCETDISKEEEDTRVEIEAADELLHDATSKLRGTISGSSSVSKQSITVAMMMLDAAQDKRNKAMKKMAEIGEKRKVLEKKKQRLLDKAIPTGQVSPKKRKHADCAVFLKKQKQTTK